MSYQYDDYRYSDEAREHDLKIIWKCPQGCGYSYEDYPGYNERLKCPDCGVETVEGGESYK